jgi:hypothetical protein
MRFARLHQRVDRASVPTAHDISSALMATVVAVHSPELRERHVPCHRRPPELPTLPFSGSPSRTRRRMATCSLTVSARLHPHADGATRPTRGLARPPPGAWRLRRGPRAARLDRPKRSDTGDKASLETSPFSVGSVRTRLDPMSWSTLF